MISSTVWSSFCHIQNNPASRFIAASAIFCTKPFFERMISFSPSLWAFSFCVSLFELFHAFFGKVNSKGGRNHPVLKGYCRNVYANHPHSAPNFSTTFFTVNWKILTKTNCLYQFNSWQFLPSCPFNSSTGTVCFRMIPVRFTERINLNDPLSIVKPDKKINTGCRKRIAVSPGRPNK